MPAETSASLDPDDLATTLRVLAQLHELDQEHPDFISVRRATAHMFKAVKQARRRELREAELAADRAVIAATATGAPDRIDDETRGRDLTSPTTGATTAGTLINSQACYICKQHYTQVDWFYHQLCPSCAAFSHAKRTARTDLSGKRALLTGGRAKIGMHIALRLLRDGADLTITTRFPRDAVRRFSQLPDASEWLHRLRVVGIDLRDPAQVIGLADSVASRGPLHILINNAAQTVRRSPGAYSLLADAESHPLPDGPLPELETFGHTADPHPQALQASVAAHPLLSSANVHGTVAELVGAAALTADDLASAAMAAGSSSLERHHDGTAIDAGGLVPDVQRVNTWTRAVGGIDPLELLEVQLCNTTAPFILIDRLRPSLAAAGRSYVVNVSAMEGVFGRRYKGAGHPHTNMAKAALNMLTRTSAQEMFDTDNILMTSVDTGWITDERPHYTKVRLAEEGFHAPLDLVDGAARVYDPIVRGEAGEDLQGVFLKDYAPSAW
ncbi:SDR family NAD(P)-dependent oxidoreductase [Leifsonia sp. TF02-11]|uniref:SDR family NAD(P)-dependent oxidoreductase n=1 Tax=Leifsonia sp. TF02-11 TaxID=2815212 RepID=UPI001AA18448|nr:SDR family NAD(P)-dependent oxidoreductase [Leifsonia sp. TF02-11]MBN9632754.1 SDR family NAD(P)-dependent oxidoreductase [Actinomycetota bacterium]MBO1740977.1 SDR family NAD(P)-dependent oxidoreductase [Leifsonia sp. TF02-11]